MTGDEWDWPPPRRPRTAAAPTIEGRISAERVVLSGVPRRSVTAQTWPNRAADIFFSIVLTGAKIFVAIGLALVVLACVWFVGALIKIGSAP